MSVTDGRVVIPIDAGDGPTVVASVQAPDWEVDEIDEEASRQQVTFVGAEPGTRLRVSAYFASSFDSAATRAAEPLGSGWTIVRDDTGTFGERPTRTIVSVAESGLSEGARLAEVVVEATSERVFEISVYLAADSPLDAEAVLSEVVASLDLAP